MALFGRAFRKIANYLSIDHSGLKGKDFQQKLFDVHARLWPATERSIPQTVFRRGVKAAQRLARKEKVRKLKAERNGRTKRQHDRLLSEGVREVAAAMEAV
jgi:hypothetical protein